MEKIIKYKGFVIKGERGRGWMATYNGKYYGTDATLKEIKESINEYFQGKTEFKP